MKLAAYYNSWDDWDMLQHSIKNIRSIVDVVFVVFSVQSNYGERNSGPDGSMGELDITNVPVFFRQLEPNLNASPLINETAKRNYGLDLARSFQKSRGITHVLCMDSDEFYNHDQFEKIKVIVEDMDLNGSVVDSNVYFKSPTLTIGKDVTRVPFIHKLTPTLKHEFNKNYPYAWENRQIRIDPTRSYNIDRGVLYSPWATMEHMSWVRADYAKKIRNSTARDNIRRSTVLNDLLQAKEGYYVDFYKKTLVRASVSFGIPEMT